MPRVPEMVWDDFRTGTSFGSDFARLLGGGLYGIGGIQRAEANKEKDRALKAADDARAEDHFNRTLAQNDEHFRMSRADRFALAAQKYDEGDDLFDVTDPSNPVPVPKGEHPVAYARSLGAAQMESEAPASKTTLDEWQATTDHSNQTAPRGSKTYFQATTPEQRALAAKYDASPLGQAEAKARAASEGAAPAEAPAEVPSGRVIVKGKYLASILANRRGIDKEERVGETAAARAERLKRQEGEAETAGRVLTRAMSDPEYVPTPDEMEAVSKDPRGVSLFGTLSARIQKRKDAMERETALQGYYTKRGKELAATLPEGAEPFQFADATGKPLPSAVLKEQVVGMYKAAATRQAQDFQKAMQEDRQAAAAELADYNAGKLDARTTATRSAARVSAAEARLAAAENQLRSTEVSEATAIAHSYDARGEALARSSFAEARAQAAANVEAARRALDEARSTQVVLAPKGPAGKAPDAPTEAPGTVDPREAQAAWEAANPTATFEQKRAHWIALKKGGG